MTARLKKIGTAAALAAWRDQLRTAPVPKHELRVCVGGSCLAAGAQKVVDALQSAVAEAGVAKDVAIRTAGCMGPCVRGPVLRMDDGTFYQGVKPEDAADIVREHVQAGRVVERLCASDSQTNALQPKTTDIPFFTRQTQVVLRNCGWIDPERIEEYVARDGYAALAKVLTSLTPEQVIEEMKSSGLRGRGGAGFPTFMKWDFTRRAPGTVKYVLCNADEGDPGAYMDRSTLEGDPHSVIEGMAIAAFTIGAAQGYVYVRAEYPLAVARLRKAIDQAHACGLLGNNILGSGLSFDLDIRMGSGAFVCGEETALIASIEGLRGEPRPRPPFPAQKGLWGKPTLLNNVETYANVPAILLNGAAWYAQWGTAKSKGTKVFALAGCVQNTGLVEVPVGTSLGELIYDIGGGLRGGKAYKAAQIGGPSGGCIPKENLNVPLDYESLQELGAIMGSGGLIVMDEDACMVDVARFFIEFVQEESCGKCAPCRVGTKRMGEILQRICEGKGELADLDRLEQLGRFIQEASLCGLGQTAPNPVLSTLRHFREEYVQHIRDKHCVAGVCPGLVLAPCLSACPAGVHVPGFVALVGEGRYAEALQLHRERNPFAAVCARVCFHTCEDHCRRSTLDEAVAIRSIKRFMVDQEVTIVKPEVRENEANAARKVAIVGAGPAGLTCAYFLARLGYKPVIFEAEARPGGMLVQAIPAYRLPRETLAREIRMIESLGVEIQTLRRLGRDFTLPDLRQEGYEAVFLAVGAPEGLNLAIPGHEAKGVVDSLDFLRQYNIRGSVPVGKNVVVIGGGNAAIDAARTALRLGAQKVTVVYRRTREQMPAYVEEIEEAQQEGIELRTLVAPEEFVVRDGRVTGLVCRQMTLGEFDRSGRRRAEADDEQALETIPCDQAILAVGQRLDARNVLGDLEVPLAGGWLQADPVTGQTAIPWLFAGGDAVSGPSSVVAAIGAGERAAVGMDALLTGETHAFWRTYPDVPTDYDPEADPAPYPRENPNLIALDRRRNNFDEVEQPWSEVTAQRQAHRCLRCDYGKTGQVRGLAT
ncbi:MAG TPA: NADH-ubiquinone oxidoreductase-F iron-sulfur binding region domain-containing protein [Kiritimatiellia bacterium]|jgi:NADH-quinone oxidoreductase subunit F|nr:NADH-ubiquinone oxidoreductase-F iron-sulfur binding region domain-containing protein [Kiritimatiellia bacterium]HOE36044.1 NADH-ubiquinone oxidoreductase-F iron-sulfur binding region domain-containing protein [Kiritimatiellia bacterium]HOR73468.1 NADH-ubiquinone oxidoreductase-F iron-sulfur binding region domain-containing protein [Kiritimatiellia bacterium]HOU58142.1 NADH-ubiquinone oxidoreductase-F iron-sulfur binding region domain-containing protein [Kiritimatiellia bacterium]HPK68429.1 